MKTRILNENIENAVQGIYPALSINYHQATKITEQLYTQHSHGKKRYLRIRN